MNDNTKARLIAIDWGTSNLRASLLDGEGAVIETRSAPGGIMAVQEGRFAQQLRAVAGDWMQTLDAPLVASGMIGSRQGWKEAAYVPCPASIGQVAAQLTQVEVAGDGEAGPRTLHIVPGLRAQHEGGRHDVMRGEETQIWGADLAPGACALLPGTHSKWAWVGEGGSVKRFQTFMTGELYGLLTKHGILGRLMKFGESHPQHFVAGVKEGLAGHALATHVIFAARTAGLMGTVPPEGLPDYLSGLLIGIEIAGAFAHRQPMPGSSEITLIGDDDLCDRYAAALEVAGLGARRAREDATTRGLWLVAQAARLLT
ncbi:2-dehydro-3-deoxygalactonokinase [Variovorax sp. OV329]|uniref:2-dehydro-3-deoxygalactonokinase n=1 Tax=Variovorax sp. OV329 TaxID=1882825 RepID=UPI0008F2A2F4|nr:2-dehydro-3-deoxygalactonokinase [Variovorax sp. OV329]SFM93560.1 2-keto-3-deoxygalactonate kinase [Variovorax sp. OV329]